MWIAGPAHLRLIDTFSTRVVLCTPVHTCIQYTWSTCSVYCIINITCAIFLMNHDDNSDNDEFHSSLQPFVPCFSVCWPCEGRVSCWIPCQMVASVCAYVNNFLGLCVILKCNYIEFCQYQSSDWLRRQSLMWPVMCHMHNSNSFVFAVHRLSYISGMQLKYVVNWALCFALYNWWTGWDKGCVSVELFLTARPALLKSFDILALYKFVDYYYYYYYYWVLSHRESIVIFTARKAAVSVEFKCKPLIRHQYKWHHHWPV